MLIIWTLRRTGGTNFTQWITKLSGAKATEHEPFNKDRIYGYITQNYIQNKKISEVKNEIEKLLKTPQIIKHCVETVPLEISEVLAEISTKLGYKHLFLYRKNSKYRLLSLYFAKQTGIWGPNIKNKTKEDIVKKIIKKPIPIIELINREKVDRYRLKHIFTKLSNLDSKENIKCITFEDLYDINTEYTIIKILEILNFLSINQKKEEIAKKVEEMRKKGNQKTKHLYDEFPNVEEFEKRLEELSKFSLC